jgi:hypothetical protein
MCRVLAALVILVQLVGPVRADSPAHEIAYLLELIRQSPCIFIRNGSEYDGAAAADHIEAKYAHFRDEIETTEDFIDRAATKSLLSGRPYQVQCASAQKIPAAEWLRRALNSYRQQHGPATAP